MKTLKIFSMAALALVMAACSSEDNEIQQNTQQPGTMHFTATIAAPSGDATTRTEYTEVGTTINVNWVVGDQIALVHNGVVDVAEVKTVDNVTGKATIEATITGSPLDDDVVYLAYPADAVYEATPYPPLPFTPNTTTFNKVKNQDGTLEFIQNNLDFRMGSGKLAVSGSDVSLKESVSVSSLICIWKLTLQDNAATPNALNATQLKFNNNTYIQAKATSAAKSDYYLCVVPSFIPDASGTFSFEATVGSDTYTFSKTGLNLTAGKYYQSTVTMTKQLTYPITLSAVTNDYIGSVVTTDGNVYATVAAASADSKTAAAMIAYVSGTGHGLALALEDEGQMDWNTAVSTCSGKTPTISGTTWKLASQTEWNNMITAAGSYTALRDGFSSFGGTNMNAGTYWSSTDAGTLYGTQLKYCYKFNEGSWGTFGSTYGQNTRACLAF
jgi:hypothetical protein